MRPLWRLHTAEERYNMCEVGVASGACLLVSIALFSRPHLFLEGLSAAVWFCLVLIGDLSTKPSFVPVSTFL